MFTLQRDKMDEVEFGVHIRWGIKKDLPGLIAMDDGPDAPDKEWFDSALRRREVITLVAEREGKQVGYCVYELHKAGIEVQRLFVHEANRRRKVGTVILNRLIYKTVSHRRDWLRVTVRESSYDMQCLLRSKNFKAVAVHRGDFEEPDEDGYEFVYRPTLEDHKRAM